MSVDRPTPGEWRDSYLKAIEFKNPKWIIGKVVVQMDAWYRYKELMEEIVLKHPLVFPFYKKGSVNFDDFGSRRKGCTFIDPWGCKWAFLLDGLQGQVVEHPLSGWRMWESYRLPDPEEGIPQEGSPTVPWSAIEESVERAREVGGLVEISMGHGFFFQRLYYLRGFRNLLRDFVLKPPRIYELIEALESFYLELARRAAELKPDIVSFGDDLGTQTGMPISPKTFREFIFPAYKRIFGYLRGRVVEVLDQLVETGVFGAERPGPGERDRKPEEAAEGACLHRLGHRPAASAAFRHPERGEGAREACNHRAGVEEGRAHVHSRRLL